MEYGYLDKEVKALVNERDRLAAENAELKDLLAIEQIPHADANEQLAAANATLDKLREAVPRDAGAWCEECCACVALDEYLDCAVCGGMPDNDTHATCFVDKLQAILYLAPTETPDDHE